MLYRYNHFTNPIVIKQRRDMIQTYVSEFPRSKLTISLTSIAWYSNSAIPPQLRWAQRQTEVYVTIDIQDAEAPQLELTENRLSFSARSHGQDYSLQIDFFDRINVEVLWPMLDHNL